MKRRHCIIATLSLALMLTSCHETIHEHPDGTEASVTVTLTVDNHEPELYTVVDYTDGTPVQTSLDLSSRTNDLCSRTIDPTQWQVHIVWRLYNGSLSDINGGRAQLVGSGVGVTGYSYQPTYVVAKDIPQGCYTLLAWADYTPTGTEGDYYYNTSDLSHVQCDLDRRTDCADNDQRDCFCTAYQFTVSGVREYGESRTYNATLTRPQGRYIVLVTDYKKYLQLTDRPVEESTSTVTYPSFINTGYNLQELRPNEGTRGLSYRLAPTMQQWEGQGVVRIADDYSLVNGSESHVTLDMKVSNPTLGVLSTNSGIDVPLYPDKLTVVVGRFLTGDSKNGGLTIDDGFEDEWIIHF